jgi:hypothetical protein
MPRIRRACAIALAGLVAVFLAVPGASAAPAEDRLPNRIDLPNGFRPEGIAIGSEPIAYLGSLADGDIYAANLRTGAGRVIAEGPGTPSVGMKLDDRGRLFVAGGTAGEARLIDVHTGDLLATWEFADPADAPTFVNDVVLTERTAWFTDSQRPVLYGVPIARDGSVGEDFVTLELTNEWEQVPDAFNANGIARTPDGRALLVVNGTTGGLYRVNMWTGDTRKVDLGGEVLTAGDGLWLEGRRLYVARNRLNLVVKVVLGSGGFNGRVTEEATRGSFDVPTTIASFRHRLYLPNARFTTTPEPDTPYWITSLRQF